MAIELDLLRAVARRRYRFGQWRVALSITWPALVLLVASWAAGCGSTCLAAAGVLLISACLYCGWRGGGARRAVLPALAAGALPALLPLVNRCAESACTDGCGQCACDSNCLVACWVAGCGAALLLGASAAWEREARSGYLVAGSGIVAIAGALGCWVGGVPGLLGLFLAAIVLPATTKRAFVALGAALRSR